MENFIHIFGGPIFATLCLALGVALFWLWQADCKRHKAKTAGKVLAFTGAISKTYNPIRRNVEPSIGSWKLGDR